MKMTEIGIKWQIKYLTWLSYILENITFFQDMTSLRFPDFEILHIITIDHCILPSQYMKML